MSIRKTYIHPNKLDSWVNNFHKKHENLVCEFSENKVEWHNEKGIQARLTVPYIKQLETANISTICEDLSKNRTVAIVFLRRSGYAIGKAEMGKLVTSKVGSKYVQGQTAAGGWSQKRFARRRETQTNNLLESAKKTTQTLLCSPANSKQSFKELDGIVLGGDKNLLAKLLQNSTLLFLTKLPQFPNLEVEAPRLKVLEKAAITVTMFPLQIWE